MCNKICWGKTIISVENGETDNKNDKWPVEGQTWVMMGGGEKEIYSLDNKSSSCGVDRSKNAETNMQMGRQTDR